VLWVAVDESRSRAKRRGTGAAMAAKARAGHAAASGDNKPVLAPTLWSCVMGKSSVSA